MGHHSLWCCTNPENPNYKWEMNLARATKVKRRQGEKWGNKWASDYFLYMKWLKLILNSYKCSNINCIYVVISDFLSKCFYTHINTFILFYFWSIRLAPLHIHSNTGVILVFSVLPKDIFWATGHFLSHNHPRFRLLWVVLTPTSIIFLFTTDLTHSQSDSVPLYRPKPATSKELCTIKHTHTHNCKVQTLKWNLRTTLTSHKPCGYRTNAV